MNDASDAHTPGEDGKEDGDGEGADIPVEQEEVDPEKEREERERREREEEERKQAEEKERIHRENVERFIEMLRSKHISPFSSWKKELPKLCVDPRFSCLSSQIERQEVFEQYMRGLSLSLSLSLPLLHHSFSSHVFHFLTVGIYLQDDTRKCARKRKRK
jgi:hypothetical protein